MQIEKLSKLFPVASTLSAEEKKIELSFVVKRVIIRGGDRKGFDKAGS